MAAAVAASVVFRCHICNVIGNEGNVYAMAA